MNKSYLNFVEIKDSKRKTKQFYVSNLTIEPLIILGYISFYPAWRKYIFHPNNQITAIFDPNCLREIADFCEKKTNEWKETFDENKSK